MAIFNSYVKLPEGNQEKKMKNPINDHENRLKWYKTTIFFFGILGTRLAGILGTQLRRYFGYNQPTMFDHVLENWIVSW